MHEIRHHNMKLCAQSTVLFVCCEHRLYPTVHQ